MPPNQMTKKKFIVLGAATDPDYKGKTGLLLHNRSNKEHVWNIGDPLGYLLMPPCHVIKVSGKL